MRFVCLGYFDEGIWEAMSESERTAFIDACFAYDEELQRAKHMVGGEGLTTPREAATVRWKSGRVAVTDGPFAETKEQIGGLMYLEARDLNQAIQLMSKHPGVRVGGFEIRAIDPSISELFEARKKA